MDRILAGKKDTNGLCPDLKGHLEGKTPATRARYYDSKGEAIEFVYKDDIPIKDVKPIGKILNVNSLKYEKDYDKNNPAKSILLKCLQGEQEAKAIKFLR